MIRYAGLCLCLPPHADLVSGFTPLDKAPSWVYPHGSGAVVCWWGPLLPSNPLPFILESQGSSYRVLPRGGKEGVLVKERLCTDLGRLMHSASFTQAGLVSGKN